MDSTVCTALLNKALPREQVIAVHIDNGFMRKKESQSVEEALTKLGIDVKGKSLDPTSGNLSLRNSLFSESVPCDCIL